MRYISTFWSAESVLLDVMVAVATTESEGKDVDVVATQLDLPGQKQDMCPSGHIRNTFLPSVSLSSHPLSW